MAGFEDAVVVSVPGEDADDIERNARIVYNPDEAGKVTAANVARQFGQGALFGLADEAEALSAYFTDEDYSDALARIRRENTAFQRDNPGYAAALQFGGAIPAAFLPGGALAALGRGAGALGAGRAAAGLGRAAAVMNPANAAGMSVGGLVREGIKQGGIQGGIHGFGSGEGGFIPRVGGAVVGGGVGAAAGGVLSPIVGKTLAGLRAGKRAALDAPEVKADRVVAQTLSESDVVADDAIVSALPMVPGAKRGPEATRNLAAAWARGEKPSNIVEHYPASAGANAGEQISARKISAQFKEWDAPSRGGRTITDIVGEMPGQSGEAAERAAERAFTRAGRGGEQAAARFGERHGSHVQRIGEAIDDASGAGGRTNALRRINERGDDLRQWAGPAYDDLANRPLKLVEGDPGLALSVNRLRGFPEFTKIEEMARRIAAADEQFGLHPSHPQFADDQGIWSFDVVNHIRKSLSEAANPQTMSSVADRNNARLYKHLLSAFDDTMDTHFSGYKQVRAAYHEGQNILRAADAGDDAIFGTGGAKGQQSVEDVFDRIRSGKASADEQQAFRELAGIELTRRAGGQGDGANAARQFTKPNVESRILEVFGKKDGQKLVDALGRESRQVERVRKITGGSPTARRIVGIADEEADSEIAGAALTGNIPGMWSSLSNWVSVQLARGKADKVADLFSRMDEKEVIAILDRVSRMQAPMERSNQRIGSTTTAVSTAVAKALARRAAEDASRGLNND